MNIDWNAEDYHKNFAFVYEYGEALLNLFTLPKGSFIADVGCGSAVLTKKLKEAGYGVCGIDASREMTDEECAELECNVFAKTDLKTGCGNCQDK